MVSGSEQDELRRLLEENPRLKDLLTRHGITWEEPCLFTRSLCHSENEKFSHMPNMLRFFISTVS